ncbi:helix-turn-helix transcriptional regulator [Phytomonospora sp. NPDC050363]|uniref:helix-turn-helix domain-containing protein n=1 Tax=Phytomonospora sp. NPDC050363 TaxID=3155642 RepID=UPI00340C6EE0
MPAKKFPTLRAQWLGEELRKHRMDANVTLADAGQYLQRDQGTISRIENGLVPARVADVMALLNFYGVDDPMVRANLEQISRDAWQKGWWDGYSKHAPAWMLDLAWMESRARHIRSFDPIVFHGMLQTEEFARALIAAGDPDVSSGQIDKWVDLRMERKRILAGNQPVRFSSVVDESVLRRRLGGTEVIRGQLRHLLNLADNSSVQIRVLPGDARVHPAPNGAFALLDLPEPYPHVGHIDTVSGNLWVEGEEADVIAKRYDRLESAALSPADSAAKIRQLLKELE